MHCPALALRCVQCLALCKGGPGLPRYNVSFAMESIMSQAPACPQCTLVNTYADGALMICADCGFEWAAGDEQPDAELVVRDSNGNTLANGDTVTVIKDLKVKGSSIPLKQGTVIRNIRLVTDDAEHIEGNSEKIKGLVLKTCFLRKA